MSDGTSEAWQAYLDELPDTVRAVHERGELGEDVLSMEGRTVTRTQILDVLAEQVALPAGFNERPIRRDQQVSGLIAAAWRNAARGQARAVLLLLSHGLDAEALTNARGCLEHTAALIDLANAADEDRVEELLSELAGQVDRNVNRELKHLTRWDIDSGGANASLLLDAREHLHSATSVTKRRRVVRDMFFAAFGEDTLYDVYSRLSESAHAGVGSALPYLLPAVKHGKPVSDRPNGIEWAEYAAVLCWCCWAMDDATARLYEGAADLSARHDRLLARIGLRRPSSS